MSVSAYIRRSNLAKRGFSCTTPDKYTWLKAECQSLSDRDVAFFESHTPEYMVNRLLQEDIPEVKKITRKPVPIKINLPEKKYVHSSHLKKRNKLSKVQRAFVTSKIFTSTIQKKIIAVLSEGEHNITEISLEIKKSHDTVSRHIKQLREARFLNFRREGQFIYCELNDNFIRTVEIIRQFKK